MRHYYGIITKLLVNKQTFQIKVLGAWEVHLHSHSQSLSLALGSAWYLLVWSVVILAQVLVVAQSSSHTSFNASMDLLGRRDFAAAGATRDQIVAAAVRAPGLGVSCLHRHDFVPLSGLGSSSGTPAAAVAVVQAHTGTRPHRSRSRPAVRPSASAPSPRAGPACSSELRLAAPNFGLQSLDLDESLPSNILLPQLAHRVQLAETVEACFAAAWSPATRRSYSSALRPPWAVWSMRWVHACSPLTLMSS